MCESSSTLHRTLGGYELLTVIVFRKEPQRQGVPASGLNANLWFVDPGHSDIKSGVSNLARGVTRAREVPAVAPGDVRV